MIRPVLGAVAVIGLALGVSTIVFVLRGQLWANRRECSGLIAAVL